MGLSMRWRGFASGALLAVTLLGCAFVDPLDSRYDTISRSLAKARNEAIFLNVVRASNDDPLNFTTIANVTPSLTNTTSLALPNFLVGPRVSNPVTGAFIAEPAAPARDVTFGNTTAGNTTAVSTNFNVSTEETGAFYDGFLKPIDLQTLDYFIRQGYSRELLFWLFTESVEIVEPDHKLLFAYNPPENYGCPIDDALKRCFGDVVLIAMAAGLTVEGKTIQKPASSGQARTAVVAPGNQLNNSSKPETTSYFRFCFDPLLAKQAQGAMDPQTWDSVKVKWLTGQPGIYKCGDKSWDPRKDATKPLPDTLDITYGKNQYRIKPRSAFGIFEFLGAVIKLGRDHPQPFQGNGNLKPKATELPKLQTVGGGDPYILRVTTDGAEDCFVTTTFNNRFYCIPESASNSKRIFNLLAQLIAIETSATDLSITPTVRVVQ
jgi:hypothetical protein